MSVTRFMGSTRMPFNTNFTRNNTGSGSSSSDNTKIIFIYVQNTSEIEIVYLMWCVYNSHKYLSKFCAVAVVAAAAVYFFVVVAIQLCFAIVGPLHHLLPRSIIQLQNCVHCVCNLASSIVYILSFWAKGCSFGTD